MELCINSEVAEVIEKYMDIYPLAGVTCNPKMISGLKDPDFFGAIKKIRKAVGDKNLFVQVISPIPEEMVEEAYLIRKAAGEETIIKIPANETGIKAIKMLSAEGIRTLGTVVHTASQGILALHAGAEYIAPFWCHMLEADIDAFAEVRKMSNYAKKFGRGKILVASTRSGKQFSEAIDAGADAITMEPYILSSLLKVEPADYFVDLFVSSWESTYGVGKKIIDFV